MKSSWFKLVSTSWSTVLSRPCQLGFLALRRPRLGNVTSYLQHWSGMEQV